MKSGTSQKRLADVANLSGKTIIVLGDVMLDTFVYGDCVRVSPEAPIPVLRVVRETTMLGGAGNVARNIAALGGRAILIGIIGDDAAGASLRAEVDRENGISASFIVDGRPTTQKIRYVAHQQQMLRADIETNVPADPQELLSAVRHRLAEADALVLSDYGKGVLSPTLLREVIDLATTRHLPVVADPKNVDIARYDGVTMLTPNATEAAAASGASCDSDVDVERAGGALMAAMPTTRAVLVTRGASGMTLIARDGPPLHLPAVARGVFDVSGAGDTVVATVALALAAAIELTRAVDLGNCAAGLAVGKPGTAVITAAELAHALCNAEVGDVERKIVTRDEAVALVVRWRASGDRIGFTNGCFDLIHPGHVSQLSQARATCDRLIVGLNSDDSIRRLKGPARPVQQEVARAIVLSSLGAVDAVVIFDADTPIDLIASIRPDVLVKGKDYAIQEVVGADLVQSYGGRVFLADIVPGQSTTAIISRLAEEAA